MLHYFKRMWLRILIKIKRNGTRNDRVHKSEFELEVLKICRILIRNISTNLLVCPDTQRRFIIFDPMEIKIIISDDKIIVSNHTYYYELSISKSGLANVIRVFDGNVKERRDILEQDIKTNAKTSLNLIFTNTLQRSL